MIIDEKLYLEHFGVKGMKWGVRKAINTQKRRKLRKYGDKKTKPLTKSQKEARKERNVNRAIFGTRTAIGAAFIAAMFISKDTGRPPPGFRFQGDGPTTKTAQQVINAERNIKISAIKRTHKEGHMDNDQLKSFLSSLNKRYDRKIIESLNVV